MADPRGPLKNQALAVLKSRGVPVQTILDVGVNTVTPELVAAFPDRHHVLFEPVEEYFEGIERHYARVPHELVKAAVSDSTGTVTLKTASKLQGQGISHAGMVPGPATDTADTRTVPMVRLDDFLRERQLPGPYLLKIDIDGHEMKVLRGAVETLKACSVVIVECPHHSLPERLSHLMKAGFRLFDLVEPCYYDKVFWQCDAVFLREDLYAQKFQALGGKVVPGLYEMFR
jgi:FkbM family methyltransferase